MQRPSLLPPALPRPLQALFWAMAALTLLALLGLALDRRTIAGAPAWLKPLKFALSTALYSVSFGWTLGYLEGRPRLKRALVNITAGVLAVELTLIFVQAARGLGSHFNVGTPLDAGIFTIMGGFIAVLWVCQVVAAVLLLRQPFADPALAWSLRLGMILAVLGGAVGALMSARLAHTVGAPDGGPGLPLTNWSLAHGDLRPAHFLGLHALQLLPLLAWAASKLRWATPGQRARLVITAGASYGALLLLLVAQAFRGRPILPLDGAGQAGLALWALATAALAIFALVTARPALEAA